MEGKVACFSSPRLLHILFAKKRQRAVLRLVDLPAAGRRPLLVLVQPLLLIFLLFRINPRLKKKLLNQRRAKSAAGELYEPDVTPVTFSGLRRGSNL